MSAIRELYEIWSVDEYSLVLHVKAVKEGFGRGLWLEGLKQSFC